jgi:tetratricopeptide (TPR) repeat protein
MLLKKGQELFEKHEYKEAIKRFNLVLVSDPNNIEAWNTKGLAIEALLPLQEEHHGEQFRQTYDYMENKSWCAHQIGYESDSVPPRFDIVAYCFKKTLEIDPKNYIALFKMGKFCFEMEDYLSAYAYFSKAQKSNQEIIEPQYWKVNCLVRLEIFEEAIDLSSKLIELDPNNSTIWLNKGLALSKLGRYQEALISLEKSLQLEPQNKMAIDEKKYVLEHLQEK